MSFPCTACGACCRRVGAVLEARHPVNGALAEAVAQFPYQARPDGSCDQLTDAGRCAVYGDRPMLCRVDVMQAKSGLPAPLYHAVSAAACNAMQDADGLPSSFRVLLPPSPTDV